MRCSQGTGQVVSEESLHSDTQLTDSTPCLGFFLYRNTVLYNFVLLFYFISFSVFKYRVCEEVKFLTYLLEAPLGATWNTDASSARAVQAQEHQQLPFGIQNRKGKLLRFQNEKPLFYIVADLNVAQIWPFFHC